MKKQFIYIFLKVLYSVLLFLSCALSAQDAPTLWCHELDISEGLTSQQYNFFVSKDSEDFVWVSSLRGLNRFDGKNVKQYRSDFSDSTQLYGENIQSKMYEDVNKNLWFCTYMAVHCYNRENDEFRHFFVRDKNGAPVKEDYNVFHIQDGRELWFRAGDDGGDLYNIYRVDISTADPAFEELKPVFKTGHYHLFAGLDESGKMKNLVTCSGKRIEGLEYFEWENGTFVLKKQLRKETDEQWGIPIYQSLFEAPHFIWLATGSGMKKWNLSTDELTSFPFDVRDYVFFQKLDEDYFIVSDHSKGVFLFNRNTGEYNPYSLRSIDSPNKKLDRNIRNIYLDEDQVLWVPRVKGGIAYASLKKRKFDFINNMHTSPVSALYENIFELSEGSYLVVRDGGWFNIDAGGRLLDRDQFVGMRGVRSAAMTRSDELILGTGSGIYCSNLETNKTEIIAETKDTVFLDLCFIEENKILALNMSKGIQLLTKKEGVWQKEGLLHESKAGSYSDVFQSSAGDIFVCDNNSKISVFNFKNNQLAYKDSLPVPGEIYDYYEDDKRKLLWIATSFGLVRISTIDLQIVGKPYLQKDGLSDNIIYAIQPDARNRLWLSTFKGLSLFDPETEKGTSFSLADGIGSEQFLEGASLKLADGTIWFGGENGIMVIKSDSLSLVKKRPRILITDFKIDGDLPLEGVYCTRTGSTNINQVEALEYNYLKNSLSFEFVATDYSDPQNALLRYRLEKAGGPKEKWKSTKAGEKAVARYQHLPHGQYQLEIEALNSDANPDFISRKVIHITILPRIWERTWFWPLISSLGILLVYGYYQWRLKEVQQTEELKTKIAISKMQALLGQMNPHFIFNSLQSVNRFILKGEKRQASEYLGRFSGLIRLMLENSRNTRHLVETEVKFLLLYMKVEAQRFKHTFTYEINVDEEIDPTFIKIPSMMLQPFVENAIWHGISHRVAGGHIKINLDLEGDVLQCTIEDNGVGMKAAIKIAEARGKTHKSRAMGIVKDRLKLLFPKQQEMCEVNHEDIVDEKGEVRGTRAVVRLPV